MKEQITRENYMGYKKLYIHKNELPCSILLMILLNILIIGSCMIVCLPIVMSGTIDFCVLMLNYIVPVISSGSAITLIYDYNKKIYQLKKEYPYINSGINTKNLKTMIDQYEYQMFKPKIDNCEELKEEILEETIHNYSSLECNKIPEEELIRVKVKVKTLLNNRRR